MLSVALTVIANCQTTIEKRKVGHRMSCSYDNISIDAEEVATDICCASCGIAEVDDVKLKPCDGCDLVKYCSDTCKEDHRLQHETLCRERAAELRDEIYAWAVQ